MHFRVHLPTGLAWGPWSVPGILMGRPSHLSWLLLMQMSSGEPSDSLRQSQLFTPISCHSLGICNLTRPHVVLVCFNVVRCLRAACESWRLDCGRAENKRGWEWSWVGGGGRLRTFSLLCSVLHGGEFNFISQVKPYSTVIEKRSIRYFGSSNTVWLEKQQQPKSQINTILHVAKAKKVTSVM